ncbi:MAG TPA: hypothetical protein VFL29_10910 [Candidatus Dormibacteraeota bacterium]|nr:hypothetical protein [Candidatus Dormibacteraeota bacterium]
MTFSDEITTLALDLVRSLWAELGIGGSPCRHDWQAIDLEPLIIFTASLAATDDVFISRTIRWCAINATYISSSRLRNLARRFTPATRDAAEKFMRVVHARAKEDLENGEFPDLKRPSLIQLRLRALVGVGARAEVLRLMLAEPSEQRDKNELIDGSGMAATVCELALDALTAAGITKAEVAGAGATYRLSRPGDLAIAVSGVPVAFPDWVAILMLIDAIRAYASTDEDQAHRASAAKKLSAALRTQFGRLDVDAQAPLVESEASVPAFDEWARSFVEEHAGATQRAEAHEASYSVHRLALGGWIATVSVAGSHPRPLALSENPVLRPERRKQRRGRRDSLGDAAAVVEMMLQDMLTRAMQRRLGSTVTRTSAAEPLLGDVSREFAAELLLPMHAGQATNFSEKFLQRWLANRRHWHDMTA